MGCFVPPIRILLRTPVVPVPLPSPAPLLQPGLLTPPSGDFGGRAGSTSSPAGTRRIVRRWSRAPIPRAESFDQPGEVAIRPAGDAGTSTAFSEPPTSVGSNQPPDRQTAHRKTSLTHGCLPPSNARGVQEPDSGNLRLQTEPLEPLLRIVADGAHPFVREADGSRVVPRVGLEAVGWPSSV